MPESETAPKLHRILVINPTATATHVAVFDNEKLLVAESLAHTPEELLAYERVWDQFLMRKDRLGSFLERHGIAQSSLSAVVGRGGLLKPVPGGVYRVNAAMLDDLRRAPVGEHASNLGAILAYAVAHAHGIEAFIVDPISTDEMEELARLSGLPEVPRTSLVHALNQRWMARKAALEMGKPYRECRMVVAHLGVGISVSAHVNGRIVDTTNALDSGPFSPERAGMLPVGDVVRLAFCGKYTERELIRKLTTRGGLTAHLGTGDYVEVERRIQQGDPVAMLVYEAMAYQIAKEIGAMTAAIGGHVDGLVLTGPVAASAMLVGWIRDRIAWMGEVKVYPGGAEMQAMAVGALRVLQGEEEAQVYA